MKRAWLPDLGCGVGLRLARVADRRLPVASAWSLRTCGADEAFVNAAATHGRAGRNRTALRHCRPWPLTRIADTATSFVVQCPHWMEFSLAEDRASDYERHELDHRDR